MDLPLSSPCRAAAADDDDAARPAFRRLRLAGVLALSGLLLGASLAVPPRAARAQATSDTWLGGTSSSWATGSNWSTGSVPTRSQTVIFTGSVTNMTANIISPVVVNSLQFTSSAGAYTISASGSGALDLDNGGITDNSTSVETISAPISLFASDAWTVASGGDLSITGSISGANNLSLSSSGSGSGEIDLLAVNTYTGTTTLTGNLSVYVGDSTHTGSLGTGNVSVGANDTLQFGGSSSAGSGTITNDGFIQFAFTSTAASTSLVNNSDGAVDIEFITGSSLSLGSLSGSGSIYLGNKTLMVGGLNTSTTFSGVISDGGFFSTTGASLIKTGTGTLTLSGANTYTGGTTLSAGTLSLGSSGAIGTSGTITFSGGTLQWNSANTTDYSSRFSTAASQAYSLDTNGQNVTLAGALTSSGGTLAKSGSGTLTLTGANTYSGATTISAGTLKLGDGSTTNGSVAGSITDNAALIFANPNAQTYSGTLSGSGSLTKSGSGNLTLSGANPLSGTTTISGGTLTLGGASALNDSTLAYNGSGGTLSFGTLTGASLGGLSGSQNLALTNTSAGGVTLDVGYNNTSTTYSGSLSGAGNLVKEGTGTLTLTGANNFTGYTGVVGGTLLLGNTLALQDSQFSSGAGGTLSFGALPSAAFGGLSGTGNLALTNSSSGAVALTLNLTGNASYTYSGILSGSGSLIVSTGTGAETLTGANTFTGTTTISAGVLQLGDGSTTNGSVAGNITDNAALIFANPNAQTYTGTISGSGTLTKSGSGSLTLSGANTFSGTTTVTGGTLTLGNALALQDSTLSYSSSGGVLSFGTLTSATLGGLSGSQNLALANAGASAVSLSIGNNNGSTTYSGVLSGSGSLTNSGSGTLTLTGANTFTGGTTITKGTIAVGTSGGTASTASLGPGDVSISGGSTLAFYAASSAGSSSSTQISVGSNSFLTFYNNSTAGSTSISNSGYMNFSGSSSAGSAIITNNGSMDFGNSTSAGSATIINNDFIYVGASSGNTLGSGAKMTNNGIIDFYLVDPGSTVAFGSLSGGTAGDVNMEIDSGSATSLTLSVGALNLNDTYAGTISDGSTAAGSLVKVGTGTLTLTGANTYRGTTTISAGTLVAANSSALGTSAVSISSGATLEVGAALNKTNAAQSVGSLSVTSLTVASNSGNTAPLLTFDLGSGGTSDTLTLTASSSPLTFSGAGNILVGFASATDSSLGSGTYDLMSFATPQSAASLPSITSFTAAPEGNLSDVNGGQFSYLTDGSGNVTGLAFTLTSADATPEPGALPFVLLVGVPTAAAGLRRRRAAAS